MEKDILERIESQVWLGVIILSLNTVANVVAVLLLVGALL